MKKSIIQSIHQQALRIVKVYKGCELELIEVLEQVDKHRVAYQYGCNSTFEYATKQLGLSRATAYIFINVARKTREAPSLKQEIKQGTISVSKACKMTSVINSKNQEFWVHIAKHNSTRILERQVALANPKVAVRESMSYVHPTREIRENIKLISLVDDSINTMEERTGSLWKKQNLTTSRTKALQPRVQLQVQPRVQSRVQPRVQPRVQLQVGVSEKLMLNIRRAQDVFSQKSQKPASLEDTLEAMVDFYIARQDPMEKAKRQMKKGKLDLDKSTLHVKSFEAQQNLGSVDPQLSLKNGDLRQGLESVEPQLCLKNSDLRQGLESVEPQLCLKNSDLRQSLESVDPQLSLKNGDLRQGLESIELELNLKNPDQLRSLKRVPLSAKTKHEVMIKFDGKCAHQYEPGKLCGSRRHLQIHHKTPVSKGGSHDLSNLELLCSGHHRVKHTRVQYQSS